MKIDYEKKMQEVIQSIEGLSEKKKLLLHSCCAPCSAAVIEYLQQYFDVTIFFYNPNITDEEEYYKRLEEHKEFLKKNSFENIELIQGEYNPSKDFFTLVKGLEDAKEGGERCSLCYEKRLTETARMAEKLNFEYFTTVLSISPLKNSKRINEIGERLQQEHQVKYLYADFKKKGRYQRGVQLSKENNLYRQNYCGCIFSKVEIEKKNEIKKDELKNAEFKDNQLKNNEFKNNEFKNNKETHIEDIGSNENNNRDEDKKKLEENILREFGKNENKDVVIRVEYKKGLKKEWIAVALSLIFHILLIYPYNQHMKKFGETNKVIKVSVISMHEKESEKKIENKKEIEEIVKEDDKGKKQTKIENDMSEKKEKAIADDTVNTDNSSDKDRKKDSQEGEFEIDGNGERILLNQDIDGVKYEILNAPDPKYPIYAKKFRIKEKVAVKTRILVNKQGTVERIDIIEGNEKLGFTDSVKETVEQWKFSPAEYKGEKIKLYFYKEFIFETKN